MARLFTVEVIKCEGTTIPSHRVTTWYECDFAGTHFSREDEANLQKWVRIMARNVYGPKTKVIFIHREEA